MKKVLIALVCYIVLVGCGNSGISKEQYESVMSERDYYKEQLESMSNKCEEEEGAGFEENPLEPNSKKVDTFPTSEQLLLALKLKNEHLIDVEAFDESTDPNRSLGRPGKYITKADFSDSRVEQIGEYLCGGTIETFSNKDDCRGRAEYLNSLSGSSVGAFGVNQYIYEYDYAVFRVDFDLNPEQAEQYHKQMTEIIEQWENNGTIDTQINETSREEREEELSEKFEVEKYSMERTN